MERKGGRGGGGMCVRGNHTWMFLSLSFSLPSLLSKNKIKIKIKKRIDRIMDMENVLMVAKWEGGVGDWVKR